MSPKFSAGADAASGAAGSAGAVEADALPVAAALLRAVVGVEGKGAAGTGGFAGADDTGVVAEAAVCDAAARGA